MSYSPASDSDRSWILYVEDGVGLYGRPDDFFGWVWARHYFTKGGMPVRFLLPMDVLSEAEVLIRILRDGFRIPVLPQRTDSLGNLLLDLEEPDPEYHC